MKKKGIRKGGATMKGKSYGKSKIAKQQRADDMGYNMTPKFPTKKFASKAKVAKLRSGK